MLTYCFDVLKKKNVFVCVEGFGTPIMKTVLGVVGYQNNKWMLPNISHRRMFWYMGFFAMRKFGFSIEGAAD